MSSLLLIHRRTALALLRREEGEIVVIPYKSVVVSIQFFILPL